MQLWRIIIQIHKIYNKLDTVGTLKIAHELNAISDFESYILKLTK